MQFLTVFLQSSCKRSVFTRTTQVRFEPGQTEPKRFKPVRFHRFFLVFFSWNGRTATESPVFSGPVQSQSSFFSSSMDWTFNPYICIIGITWWQQRRQGQGHYEMTTMTMNGHHQLWWQPSVPPPTGMAMSPNMMTMKGSKMRGPRDVYDVSWVVFFIHMFSFKYFYSYDNDTKQSAPPIPTTTTTTTPPTRCHVISCKRLKGPRASTLLTALGPQVCFFLVMSILNQ